MIQVLSILFLVAMMIMVVPYMKQQKENGCFQRLLWILFVCYLCSNLYFTLLSRKTGTGAHLNLIPFQIYSRLAEAPTARMASLSGLASIMLSDLTTAEGVFLNVLLYCPLGYLLPILFPKLKPKNVILIGCLCSIATEAIQYILKMGWCETDDVIHNTLGTVIGVIVWRIQLRKENKYLNVKKTWG